MTDAGDKTVSFKPQYTRGGWIFTCPVAGCSTTINSHDYINVGYFPDACIRHFIEVHGQEAE